MRRAGWQHIDRPELSLIDRISKVIAQHEFLNTDGLPQLNGTEPLVIASDFGGQHKQARYYTYAYLICQAGAAASLVRKCQQLRRDKLGFERTLSFKGLSDYRKREALPGFLIAADTTPGLLLCICIRKDVPLFLDEIVAEPDDDAINRFTNWNRRTRYQFLVIAHLCSLAVASISSKGQDVVWLSDDEAFTQTVEQIRDATSIFSRILGSYLSHDLGHIRFGTSRLTDWNMQTEDLVSFPDLAAGAMAESAPAANANVSERLLDQPTLLEQGVKPKANFLTSWLFSDSVAELKRVHVVVEPQDLAGTTVRALHGYIS